MISSKLLVAALAGAAYAQSNSSSPTPTVTVTTATGNASLLVTSINLAVDDMWNVFVGTVSYANTTTTVSPTPVPSSELVPPPFITSYSWPSGQQVPMESKNESWSFPKDFWWGVASAAYQIEGAVKDEGRGPSIWDVLTHRVPDFVVNNDTGDVVDNGYYMYKQDIARIAAMGVKTYSFSISWSRIMPFGKGPVNEQGLAHYEDVIDTCIQYGVQPAVTLYHWDLPLYLQNTYGGWLSEKIVDDFAEYATVVFQRYGNKVPHWFTVNEPIVFCDMYPLPDGFFTSTSIPSEQQKYFCGQSVLLAHAKAYHIGKQLGLNGTISFKTNGGYKIPLTNSPDDATATQRAWDFNEGWFANPVFVNGDYPASLKAYTSTFLRNLTNQEMASIKGTGDIFAHDAYTSQFFYAPDGGVDACISNSSNSLYPSCANTSYTYSAADGGWNIGYAADPGSPWLHKATDWVPALLKYIQKTWTPKAIALSEFGFSEPFEALKTVQADIQFDLARSSYYHDYIEAMLIGLSEGVPLVGCLGWSIADNLEWTQGVQTKFGMQFVNFTSPGRERAYKASFFQFVSLFKQYQKT